MNKFDKRWVWRCVNSAWIISVICLLQSCATTGVPLHRINNRYSTCSEVGNISRATADYFKEWKNDDFESARSLVSMCRTPFNTSLSDSALAMIEKTKGEKAAAEQADRIAREKRSADYQSCIDSREYRFYKAESSVIHNWQTVYDLTKRQDQERRYARASGVHDLSTERALGVMLVNANDALLSSFDDYRKLGGKKPPHEVRPTVKSPCN